MSELTTAVHGARTKNDLDKGTRVWRRPLSYTIFEYV